MNIKNKLIPFVLLALFFIFYTKVSANNFIEQTVNWYKFRVIKYDLSSKIYDFKIWVNEDENATSLRDLMDKNNWVSAVNGIYFCPKDYSICDNKDFTINERYVDWKKIATYDNTWERVIFALSKEKKPFLYQTNKINPDNELEIHNWVANFPLLLKDWENTIEHYWDINLIDNKMKKRMARNFICNDKEWKNLFFWYVYDIEMNELSYQLKEFWCYNAINLDAWKSTAFIYNWKYVLWPGRDILDSLIITRKWFETKPLRDASKKIINSIYRKLTTKKIEDKFSFLENLNKKLNAKKQSIYYKYSTDLHDKEWKINWYEIEITDLKNLQIVYTINCLLSEIVSLKEKIVNEEIEKQKNSDPNIKEILKDKLN